MRAGQIYSRYSPYFQGVARIKILRIQGEEIVCQVISCDWSETAIGEIRRFLCGERVLEHYRLERESIQRKLPDWF